MITVFLLSSCTTKKRLYDLEVLNSSGHIKICCIATNTKRGKTIVAGRLFLESKFSPAPEGYITITIYSPSGELLLSKNTNYQSPINHREWIRSGVYFESILDVTPPVNSRIDVAFNRTDKQ
jgi:hypothetical protein